MASTITDEAGRPTHAVLDAEECALVVPAIFNMITAVQRADPARRPPLPIERALTVLERVAAHHRPSADGHAGDATTSTMSADGHEAVTAEPIEQIMDTKQVAKEFGITERQARRRCEAVGTKVGGRWVVRRHDLERAGRDVE